MLKTAKVPAQFEPLFKTAQDYVSRYFSITMQDPTKGTIEIFGERYILVRAASMSVEFFETVKTLYQDVGDEEATTVARQLLFDIAHAIGRQDAKNFHAKMKLKSPLERLSAGPVHFAHSGWAFVDIFPESAPTEDEDYYLIYDHPFSFESDAWHKAGKKSDFPVCVMNSGYSSGWCQESFGVQLVASEIMCKARGDDACRFIMAPPHRIQGRIEEYLNKRPSLQKTVKYEIPGFFRRKQMEQHIREEKERAQRYLDTAGVMLVALDPRGRVTLMNRKGCEILGLDEADILGQDWFENFLPKEEREQGREAFHAVVASDAPPMESHEGEVLTRTGERRIVAWHTSILHGASGQIRGILSSGEDITERKQMEQELQVSREQLFQSQKLEAVGRLAGGIAHDFNNLLTAIGGSAGFLSEADELCPEDKEEVTQILESVERAAGLTRQLLAFSRKQVLKPEVLNLNAVIVGMEKLFRRTVPENIELVTTLRPSVGAVKADSSQLEQVLLNLVVNAVDAIEGGGQIIITTANLSLDEASVHSGYAIPAGDYAMITVTDTGQGIPPEIQQHIFEPFYTTKGVGKGSGHAHSVKRKQLRS